MIYSFVLGKKYIQLLKLGQDCHGNLTVGEAEQLYEELGKAIDLAREEEDWKNDFPTKLRLLLARVAQKGDGFQYENGNMIVDVYLPLSYFKLTRKSTGNRFPYYECGKKDVQYITHFHQEVVFESKEGVVISEDREKIDTLIPLMKEIAN